MMMMTENLFMSTIVAIKILYKTVTKNVRITILQVQNLKVLLRAIKNINNINTAIIPLCNKPIVHGLQLFGT